MLKFPLGLSSTVCLFLAMWWGWSNTRTDGAECQYQIQKYVGSSFPTWSPSLLVTSAWCRCSLISFIGMGTHWLSNLRSNIQSQANSVFWSLFSLLEETFSSDMISYSFHLKVQWPGTLDSYHWWAMRHWSNAWLCSPLCFSSVCRKAQSFPGAKQKCEYSSSHKEFEKAGRTRLLPHSFG